MSRHFFTWFIWLKGRTPARNPSPTLAMETNPAVKNPPTRPLLLACPKKYAFAADFRAMTRRQFRSDLQRKGRNQPRSSNH